jgi:hypothetical protein
LNAAVCADIELDNIRWEILNVDTSNEGCPLSIIVFVKRIGGQIKYMSQY